MDLLFSNYQPLKTSMNTFSDVFYSLILEAKRLDIAVGYITSDSLIELKKIAELNGIKKLNLIIGMHYWEKFTQVEYQTALNLDQYLKDANMGEVSLVTPFRFHGKLYSYSNEEGPFAGIIGSNNLSSIVESKNRVYEASAFVRNTSDAIKIQQFITQLKESSTTNISDLRISNFRKVNKLLEDHEHVDTLSLDEVLDIQTHLTALTFNIPLKVEPKSSLNVFFGKGREQKRTGLIKPRHWYEAELIVSTLTTRMSGYPQANTESAIFDVITDDGYKFKCKVSGNNSKNLRSENDLKILGKWIKGRLENAGALAVGQPVTEETFSYYGRNTITLTKTDKPYLWFLDFGVR